MTGQEIFLLEVQTMPFVIIEMYTACRKKFICFKDTHGPMEFRMQRKDLRQKVKRVREYKFIIKFLINAVATVLLLYGGRQR